MPIFLPKKYSHLFPDEHKRTLQAFAQVPLPDDVLVTFGIHKQNPRGTLVGEAIKKHSGPHIVIEKGFVRRKDYYMIGFGGLNGRADFKTVNAPSDRWRALKRTISRRQRGGDYILVLGQVPHDSSVAHLPFGYNYTMNKLIFAIYERTDRPILFRHHPLSKQRVRLNYLPNLTVSTGTLEEDFSRAFCTVSINSNSGVDSILAGIPSYYHDEGSMIKEVGSNDLDSFLEYPDFTGDRKKWAYNLAYSQWTLKEMEAGLPHKHLGLV